MALTQVKGANQPAETPLPENDDCRDCGLTLSREEWLRVRAALGQVSEIADYCEPSIRWLDDQLETISPNETTHMTLIQSALDWSPISIGVAMHVRVDPSLADVAVRLGSQMLSQSRRLQRAIGAATTDARLD